MSDLPSFNAKRFPQAHENSEISSPQDSKSFEELLKQKSPEKNFEMKNASKEAHSLSKEMNEAQEAFKSMQDIKDRLLQAYWDHNR